LFTAFDTRTGKVYHTAGQRKRQVGFITLLEPVHYSWMNQVEQWFSILQRKRLGTVNFADKKELAERLDAFVPEWNSHAHFSLVQQVLLDEAEKSGDYVEATKQEFDAMEEEALDLLRKRKSS